MAAFHPSVNADPIEAIAVWADQPNDAAPGWLEARGFQVTPMKVGLLLSAPRETFQRAFGVALDKIALPFTFPIPEALWGQVASITIPGRRDYR